MHVIRVRNVAEALPAGLAYLAAEGRWEDSRAGRVIVAPCPVTTVYERPRERVLFSALRDANPFFHCAEAVLWMLAGRRDAAFLNNFVRDFGARFAEPDGNIHDAYGYRWRQAMGFDQLNVVVRQLSNNPESRQAVVQMWDTTDWFAPELNDPDLKGLDDLLGTWKTRPCNTHAYLRIRDTKLQSGAVQIGAEGINIVDQVLDITVLCRSNDIVWGAYGANAVHFSVLQEYLAARLDVGVGKYYQISNNYHCYEDQWNKFMSDDVQRPACTQVHDNRYSIGGMQPQPLVHDAESFDTDVKCLLGAYESGENYDKTIARECHNLFLSQTVWPMLMAHRAHKRRDAVACDGWLHQIEASDWRVACTEWIERRRAK